MGFGSTSFPSQVNDQNQLQLQFLLQQIENNSLSGLRASGGGGFQQQNPLGPGILKIGELISNAILQAEAKKEADASGVIQAFREDRATREDIRSNKRAFKALPTGALGAKILPGKDLNAQVQKRFSDALGKDPEKSLLDVSKELGITLPQLIGVRAPTPGEVLGGDKAQEIAEVQGGLVLGGADKAALQGRLVLGLLDTFGGSLNRAQAEGLISLGLGEEGASVPTDLPLSLRERETEIRRATQIATEAYQESLTRQGDERIALQEAEQEFTQTLQTAQQELAEGKFSLDVEIRRGQLDVQFQNLANTISLGDANIDLIRKRINQMDAEMASGKLSSDSIELQNTLAGLKALVTPPQDVNESFDDARLVLTKQLFTQLGLDPSTIPEAGQIPGFIESLWGIITSLAPFGITPGRAIKRFGRALSGRPEASIIPDSDTSKIGTVDTQQQYDALLQSMPAEQIRNFYTLAPGIVEK